MSSRHFHFISHKNGQGSDPATATTAPTTATATQEAQMHQETARKLARRTRKVLTLSTTEAKEEGLIG
jgi:hypothetical protein